MRPRGWRDLRLIVSRAMFALAFLLLISAPVLVIKAIWEDNSKWGDTGGVFVVTALGFGVIAACMHPDIH